ncbi:polyprenol phosphomannose-dependent alpha 1,6 mannosyltransferase MptB [Paractinoplanes brasiliensis]|uniref:Alpha-1,6-mannosyltransferase n=1 Tax=Paractinoplanes brasiliensis TaxID=52695 RepID=A0A4R6JPI9_9ACTN|nr:polyprenol phosphomannose-dependent alpha 1,6 mannosyltransferase MptB [Actinoplanes brasiliensis]TDO37847.1 hypothetical protein C8E87_1482 [Actinoplanes brasiliensis]
MPRPAVVRYGGLAGSLALAVAAWLGGATNPWQPTITPGTIFAGDNGVLLPVSWLAGTGLLIAAWVLGVRLQKTARWSYVTALLWMAPLLAFLPLGSYDAYSYACQGWQQGAGLDPYAGGVDLLGCPWADAVAPTWRDAPAPYGPLFLVLAGVAAQTGGLTGTLIGLRVIALFGVALIAVALPVLARRGGVPLGRAAWLVLACPLVPIHLISGAHNDALMIGLMTAGLALAVRAGVGPQARTVTDSQPRTGVDLQPRAGVDLQPRAGADLQPRAGADAQPSAGAGPQADSQPRTDGKALTPRQAEHQRANLAAWTAGLLIGLAVAVKATALVVAPFAVLLVFGSGPQSRGGRSGPVDNATPQEAHGGSLGACPWWWGFGMAEHARQAARAGALVAGLVFGLAAASLVSGRGFGWVTALSGSGKSVQWTSPPTAVGMTIGLVGPDAVAVTRVLGLGVLAVLLVVLWWRARTATTPTTSTTSTATPVARTRDPLLYAGYALAATVLLAPVFHPWYALWPLAVLAATWQGRLTWLVVPCAVASALCLPDGYNLALAVKTQGAVFMTALIIYFAWKSVHEAKNRAAGGGGTGHLSDRLSRRDA